MFYSKKIMVSLFFFIALVSSSFAQELTTGADFVSKYVWRGADAGSDAPAVQPYLQYTVRGFKCGFWGSTPLSATANDKAINEIDIFAGYTVALANGASLGLTVTDYTYPSDTTKYGNFNNYDNKDGKGAHTVEVGLSYTGSESFPLSVSVNAFLHNVENNPVYVELGYNTTVKETALKLFAGATTGDSKLYYGIEKFGVINLGVTAAKTIKVTEGFSLPVFTSVILNPAKEKMLFVLGVSI